MSTVAQPALREYLQQNAYYPRSIYVEVTPHCNLRCPFCPSFVPGEENYLFRKQKYMSFEDFKAIVDPIIGQFNFQICFTYSGDPLMNRELFPMVRYLTDRNVPCTVDTNAGLLNEERRSLLLEAQPTRLHFSFDGGTKATYEQMRKGNIFEDVIQNMRAFMQLRQSKGYTRPYVQMQMIITQLTVGEIDQFRALAADVGVDSAYVKSLLVYRPSKNEEYSERVIRDLFVEGEYARYRRDEKGALVLRDEGICPEWQNTVITSDGDVLLCCIDQSGKYKFGNARERSLKELWDSAEFVQFRETKMKHRGLAMCHSCNNTQHVVKPLELKTGSDTM